MFLNGVNMFCFVSLIVFCRVVVQLSLIGLITCPAYPSVHRSVLYMPLTGKTKGIENLQLLRTILREVVTNMPVFQLMWSMSLD